MKKARTSSRSGSDRIFSRIAALMTVASMILTGLTLGSGLEEKLGLSGTLGFITAWAIALTFDALWVGAIQAARRSITQKSRIGIWVSATFSALAAGTSAYVLDSMGHAGVWSLAPLAGAAFWGLSIFNESTLASQETEEVIREAAANARDAEARARADAHRLAVDARTQVIAATAQGRADAHRAAVQARILTDTQARIDRARAQAQRKLKRAEKKYGTDAKAFLARDFSDALGASEGASAASKADALGVSSQVTPDAPQMQSADAAPFKELHSANDTSHSDAHSQAALSGGESAPEGDADADASTASNLSDAEIAALAAHNPEQPRSLRGLQKEFGIGQARAQRVQLLLKEMQSA